MTITNRQSGYLINLIRQAAASLFPGYFAVVMATGATSIAASLLGYRLLAILLLGSEFQLLLGWSGVAAAFWWLGVVLWSVIMYLFFIAVTTRRHKPTMDSGINGTWLLAAVSTQSVAILTALVPWTGPEDLRLFFALCMFMVGCMLYLAIITLIFYRLTFLRLSAETLSPPYWINMGAVAITTLAGSTLIIRGQEGSLLADFLPFLRGFTLFFWSIASWWIPLLIGLTFWRHVIQRHRLNYEPQLWSVVFPLAMYTTGTVRLVDALDTGFLMVIPATTLWLALIAWGATSLGMWRHFANVVREVGPS
ncbi:tellurite resistance/C4-dicarboxylate transporter family protein [Marinobacter sp.]|uniref:tellurite resistance/C4-dicarboxylate transporter family protein n=1 Tax=Marinobacter sp. TaxID=50741 RepID=UPI0023539C7B|nr:tellurite resistance/C4-dicarboxylate transporter family protein [Marinobacter sp.]